MIALSHPSFGRPRITIAEVVARLKGLVSGREEEPKPLSPEERATIRERLGHELAAVEAEAKRDLPRLATAEAKARKHLEELRPAFRAAEAAHARALGDYVRRADDLSYAEEGLRRRIIAAADPVIDEFIDDLLSLFQDSLEHRVEYAEESTGYSLEKMRHCFATLSDAPSRFALRKAILAARDQAEAWKADPDQSDIRDRLEALVRALPDGTVKVKVAEE